MFLAVIANAVQDANGRITDSCGPGMKRKRARDAMRWLTEGGVDFRAICDWAGLDWKAARKTFEVRFKGGKK